MSYVSGWKITLKAKLNSADTTLTADVDLGITNWRLYFVNSNQEEWLDFTWVSANGSNFDYTWLTRWLSKVTDPATAWTWLTWLAWNNAVLVAMHDQLIDKASNNIFLWTQSFEDIDFTNTTTWWLKVKSLTTAQRTAVTAANWMIVYDTDIWVHYQYIGWAWSTFATWAVVNASETVAGKVEIATQTEFDNWTDTWSSAELIVTPWQIKVKNDAQDVIIADNARRINYNDVLWDWSDWILNITSWTTNLNTNQIYNYTSINISAWATLSSTSTNGKLQILCQWTVTIDWTIDLSWKITAWIPTAKVLTFRDQTASYWAEWTAWNWWIWAYQSSSTAWASWPNWDWYGWGWWGWWAYNNWSGTFNVSPTWSGPSTWWNWRSNDPTAWWPWTTGWYWASSSYWTAWTNTTGQWTNNAIAASWGNGWKRWDGWLSMIMLCNTYSWTWTIQSSGWAGTAWWRWGNWDNASGSDCGWGGWGWWAWWPTWAILLVWVTNTFGWTITLTAWTWAVWWIAWTSLVASWQSTPWTNWWAWTNWTAVNVRLNQTI